MRRVGGGGKGFDESPLIILINPPAFVLGRSSSIIKIQLLFGAETKLLLISIRFVLCFPGYYANAGVDNVVVEAEGHPFCY